jgi:hypothetical protein
MELVAPSFEFDPFRHNTAIECRCRVTIAAQYGDRRARLHGRRPSNKTWISRNGEAIVAISYTGEEDERRSRGNVLFRLLDL